MLTVTQFVHMLASPHAGKFSVGVAPLVAVATQQGVEVWQYVSQLMAWQVRAALGHPLACVGGT